MKHLVLMAFACACAFGQIPQGGVGVGGGTGPENPSCTFTAATSCTITHSLNTLNVIWKCATSAGADIPVTSISGQTVNAITLGFASSTGKCVVNGTGGIGATGATGANGINGGAYSYAFSYTGSPITLTAATHGRGSTITTNYIDGTGALMFPASESINTSGDVTFSFAANTSGTLSVSGGGINQRAFGYTFDGGGAVIPLNKTGYYRVPYACAIANWSISVDTGTITIDIWKVANGTAIPVNANSITAAATPAIATGTHIKSTTLTGWTTAVATDDIVAFSVEAITGATVANITVGCN